MIDLLLLTVIGLFFYTILKSHKEVNDEWKAYNRNYGEVEK